MAKGTARSAAGNGSARVSQNGNTASVLKALLL
jgi:hypothetical protein